MWLGVIAVVFFAIVGGALVLFNRATLEPYWQYGYSQRVTGLITAYCTAPMVSDQEGARLELKGVLDSEPVRAKFLTQTVYDTAQAVVSKNRKEACK